MIVLESIFENDFGTFYQDLVLVAPYAFFALSKTRLRTLFVSDL